MITLAGDIGKLIATLSDTLCVEMIIENTEINIERVFIPVIIGPT